MKQSIWLLSLLLGLAPVVSSAQDERPNILLIVADDLGYADLGVYGSDIRTPNIDALAAEGILFTQFHTAPLCSPTRAMLLSGNNNHVAGIGRQDVTPSSMLYGLRGYEGHLSDRVALLPSLLKGAGYRTYMAGKWHLGHGAEFSPKAAGFDRSFAFEDGYANHFNGIGATEGGSVYRADGESVPWPENAYSTDFYTDTIIDYLERDKASGRPFFVYAAFTAPHWPLQVPADELDLYAGRYDMGYDRLREQRFDSLKRAGIIPQESKLPPRNDDITPWKELGAAEKRAESRKMELYAAMVDNLDRHVGRLVEYLRDNGLYENTLIVFMADNGAAGEDFANRGPYAPFIKAHYDNSYENMGRPSSWVSYGPQWAEASSAPYKRYKGFTTEGGVVAPMIIAGARVGREREISNTYLTVADLAPTFLEIAGATYPADKVPMTGESALPYLAGAASRVHGDDYVTALMHRSRVLFRRGDWKLVSLDAFTGEQDFALYNVVRDPGEVNDLSQAEPQRRADMIERWRAERRRLGIVLLEDL